MNTEEILMLLAAVAMVALAAWLLAVNWRSPVHLSFSLLFVILAAQSLAPLFDAVAGQADPLEFVVPLVQMASLLALPLVLNSFRRRHCVSHKHDHESLVRVVNVLLAASSLAFLAVFIWEPALFAPNLDRTVLERGDAPVGPLFAAAGLATLGLAWLGLVFAGEIRIMELPFHRRSFLAAALAFSLYPLYAGVSYLALTLAGATPWADQPWARRINGIWLLLAALIAIRSVVDIARYGRELRSPADGGGSPSFYRSLEVRSFLLAFGSAALCGLLVGALALMGSQRWPTVHAVLGNFWVLCLPLTLTYAILRHHLFDIDVKIRRSVKKTVIATVFISVFFLVSEGAQVFLAIKFGSVFGLLASSLVFLAVAPLQRAADRIASAAVPHAGVLDTMTPDERKIFYREQVHIAWADGSLNTKERLLLDNLRARLALSAEDAMGIEQSAVSEVSGSPKLRATQAITG